MCKARQYSDQMVCSECELYWDINDEDPPTCGKSQPTPTPKSPFQIGKAALNEARRLIAVAGMKDATTRGLDGTATASGSTPRAATVHYQTR